MKKAVKILQLARFYTPHIGGVETHVDRLNQELLKQGYQAQVISTQDSATQLLSERIANVQVWRMPQSLRSKLLVWTWIWRHRFLFMEADIVQVHDVFWWLWPVLPWIKSKVFITFHGWEGIFPVSWKAKCQRWVASKLSQGRIHVGDWIQEFYFDQPTVVTYGGVVVGVQSKITSSELKKIVFVGRLVQENEVEKYVALYKRLQDVFPGISISWLGDGPLASKCRTVGKVIGMTKFIHQEVAAADLVFASSYLSMLEAQALGKIVVALYSQRLKQRYLETYPGVAAMIIGNNVKVVTNDIKKLWNDAAVRQKMQQQAYIFASHMTWQKVVESYQLLWHSKLQS